MAEDFGVGLSAWILGLRFYGFYVSMLQGRGNSQGLRMG